MKRSYRPGLALGCALEQRIAAADRRKEFGTVQLRATHGRVELLVGIAADGAVEELVVLRGSGYPAMDRIVPEALAESRFRPAALDGCAVPAWFRLPVAFQMRAPERAQAPGPSWPP